MSGLTAVRIAALLALGYGLWVLLGGPVRVAGGLDAVSLRVVWAQPLTWLVGLLAILIGWALWSRYAWGWWLGLAAALVQLWRVGSPLFLGAGAPRLPGAVTALVLVLLVVFIVLLFMPKARATCNR